MHNRVRDRLRKIRSDFKAVRDRISGELLGLFAYTAHEAQTFALALDGLDDRLAPSTEANNRGIYHRRNHPTSMKRGILDHPIQVVRREQPATLQQQRR
jgi:hypothetical protein